MLRSERPWDLIGEFVFHGSVSNWSDGSPGPQACSGLLLVIEPEVKVESKAIRFLGNDLIGPCHLPASCGEGGQSSNPGWGVTRAIRQVRTQLGSAGQ